MITETSIITTTATFSEDRQRRYLLRKEWDDKLPQATIIMTNPSTADILTMDYTTLYIMNNLVKLGNFGSIDIVNLTANPTVKLNVKEDITENLEDENVAHILKSAEKSDSIIIAWGRIGENQKTVRMLQEKLLEHLKPFADKLYQICDDNGEFGFHPLAPSIRFVWHLIPFEIPKPTQPSEEVKTKKKTARKPFQTPDLPLPEAIAEAKQSTDE
jgi:hypothetical protein